MIKAIIFDFDGVIVESVDIKTNAFGKIFEHEGVDVAKKVVEYHLKNTGISRYEKFRYIYKEILKRPLNDKEFQILCSKFANLVVDGVIKAPYVKGAIEFLKSYASEYKCFVVSATPLEELEDILRKRDIDQFFQAVYGAPVNKSEAVKKTLLKEAIGSHETVYVGDAMSDFLAAKENLVTFIARINNNESIFANMECLKINDLTKLVDIIKDIQ